MRLGRSIARALREMRSDQWDDFKQIIGDPHMCEFSGRIASGEIHEAIMRIDCKNSPHAPKIETELNEDTSVEATESNSGNSYRSKPGTGKRANSENFEEDRDNEHPIQSSGSEGEKHTLQITVGGYKEYRATHKLARGIQPPFHRKSILRALMVFRNVWIRHAKTSHNIRMQLIQT